MPTDRRRINSLEINLLFRRPIQHLIRGADERAGRIWGQNSTKHQIYIQYIILYLDDLSLLETYNSSPAEILSMSH